MYIQGSILIERQSFLLSTTIEQPKTEISPIQRALANEDPCLSPEDKSRLKKLLCRHEKLFSTGPEDMGRTNLIYHKIELNPNYPICQGLRRMPDDQIPVLKAKAKKLQKIGLVELSASPFASPTILVKKRWNNAFVYRLSKA